MWVIFTMTHSVFLKCEERISQEEHYIITILKRWSILLGKIFCHCWIKTFSQHISHIFQHATPTWKQWQKFFQKRDFTIILVNFRIAHENWTKFRTNKPFICSVSINQMFNNCHSCPSKCSQYSGRGLRFLQDLLFCQQRKTPHSLKSSQLQTPGHHATARAWKRTLRKEEDAASFLSTPFSSTSTANSKPVLPT